MVLVLWAESLWLALLILWVVGFGDSALGGWRVRRRWLVVVGATVWILSWMPLVRWGAGWTFNAGLVALTIAALVIVSQRPLSRWWGRTFILAGTAALVRVMIPCSPHQAALVPVAVIEAVALGMVAGIVAAQPLMAAALAGTAESGACWVAGWRHAMVHTVGRYDLAAVMVAVMTAWMVGWIAAGVSAAVGRSA